MLCDQVAASLTARRALPREAVVAIGTMALYHRMVDSFARTRAGGWMFLHVFTPLDKRLMRWSNGRLSSGENPECSLLIPERGDVPCIAHEAEGDERQQAWAAANAQYSGYTVYQSRTDRRIPVMILTARA